MFDTFLTSAPSSPPPPAGRSAARSIRRAITAVLRDDPFLILQLLRTLGVDIPWRARERFLAPPLSPLGIPADLALDLSWSTGPLLRLVVVVEVALHWDAAVARACAAHEIDALERTGSRACVLVVTPDRQVAERAARPLRHGPGRSRFVPLVAGPDVLPRLITDECAQLVPSFGLIAGIAHGNDPTFGPYIRKSALSAINALEEPAQSTYLEIMSLALDDDARADWPTATSANDHSHVSDFARSYVSDARRVAKTEGEALGRARALLTVLHARGLRTSAHFESRALATTNLALLDRWLGRALHVASSDELLADSLAS